MTTGYHTFSFLQECRTRWSALALCSVVGAVLGVQFSDSMGYHYLLLMRTAVGCPVTIVGNIVSVWIPFFVSLILIVHSKSWLVYVLCTTHISRFCCVGSALQRSFGSAGWLIQGMLQFPDLCLIPALLYFAVRKSDNAIIKHRLIYGIAFGLLVGMINYLWIWPFLADLM